MSSNKDESEVYEDYGREVLICHFTKIPYEECECYLKGTRHVYQEDVALQKQLQNLAIDMNGW